MRVRVSLQMFVCCDWMGGGVELDGVEGLQEEGWWVHSTCAYLKKGFL